MYLHTKHLSKNRAFIYTYLSHGHCKWHVPNTAATLWSTQLLQKICCQHRSNYQPKSPCSLQQLPPTAETTRKLSLLLPCFKCGTLPDKTMGIFISSLGTTVVEIGKPFILTLIYLYIRNSYSLHLLVSRTILRATAARELSIRG